MSYAIEIKESCLDAIKKLSKKNPVLQNVLKKKIDEIVENPHHYKPLQYGLAGELRVHIMKSFVLKFEIHEPEKIVVFLFFGHHDDAYKR